jgi:LysR family hydrogen peroxide-inducible transcriptional activator
LIHPRSHPLSDKNTINQADLDGADLLLLAEGHCLAEQAMTVCHMQGRDVHGDMADLRAASLETLLQMVGAGFGSTLLPALALRAGLAKDRGIIAKQLKLSDTYRRVSLVYRRTFPRRLALEAFVDVVRDNLPDTVQSLASSR